MPEWIFLLGFVFKWSFHLGIVVFSCVLCDLTFGLRQWKRRSVHVLAYQWNVTLKICLNNVYLFIYILEAN